jgi:amino acid adenylation domain-containing protein
MVTEVQPTLLITDRKYEQRFEGLELRKLVLDEEKKNIAQMADAAPAVRCDGEALAYVMYTSGSTGRPKGVAIRQRSILRLVKEADYARLSPEETFLLLAPISFDASTFELWGSLLNGGRLVILREEKPSLKQIATTIVEQKVTTLWLTAGLFSLMVDYHLQALSGLRQLLVGGDVVSVPHVQKVLAAHPHVQLINGYGPTESTTFACCFSVPTGWQGRALPIGRPIAHTELYALDDQGKPLPPDVVGECYIGGEGLAQGYWQREALTREAFVPHPFSDDPNARLYRTGDLVRYTSDGEWIFIGRRDQQVKVRGYRVELSAIQSVLQQYEGVKESIVDYEREQKQLLAYVVGDVKPEEIQRFLASKLPPYMVPSQVMALKELPLTTNGKIDRKALPRPQVAENRPLPGRTPVEKRLISLWETILQRNPIGVHDHFFHLGGHSFHALQMMAVIEKEWNVQLPLATLFTHPTIAQLAERLQQEQEIQSSPLMVCLKQGQRETIPPLFMIHPQGGGILSFAALAHQLEGDRPIYALQSVGYEGEEMPLTTIEAMAEVYLQEIKQVQPQGPYYLLGWSMGGCIAHELACRLEAQGETVAWVAMLDSTWLPEEMREPFIRRITAPETIEAQAAALQVVSNAPQVVVWVNNGLAYAQYRPSQSLSADLYHFRARDEQQPTGSDHWKPFTKGKYHEIVVPGDHQSLLQKPHVQKLAHHIQRLLPRPMKV